MTLGEWAQRWGLSPQALVELGTVLTTEPVAGPGAESRALSQVRLAASEAGWRLFRNNVGACTDSDGRFIRYGLANDSKRINDALKSSDLIGIRPFVVTQAWVGHTVGQFVALEVKRPGWTYSGTSREPAQAAFLALVESLGGYGRFTTGGLT